MAENGTARVMITVFITERVLEYRRNQIRAKVTDDQQQAVVDSLRGFVLPAPQDRVP
jgi:hypothetical protein